MKDEEIAEEYKESKRDKHFNADVTEIKIFYATYLENLKQAFLAGLKAGKDINVSTKWHKVADGDLPKESFYYWICYAPVIVGGRKEGKCYRKAFYDCNLQEWETNDKGYLEKDEWICKQIIAWCEIPKYTDKE